MIRILKGFQMQILAYDPYPNPRLDVTYVSTGRADEAVGCDQSALSSDRGYPSSGEPETIEMMKEGVYLVNTSRGALIDTEALIDGLLEKKFAGVGPDVYEEEEGYSTRHRSNEIIMDENTVRLTSFPNVITSHMGFFTVEATKAIARVTLEMLMRWSLEKSW